MHYIVDKLPERPVDCPFYLAGGQCAHEHYSFCGYYECGKPTGDETDCYAFRTFAHQLSGYIERVFGTPGHTDC